MSDTHRAGGLTRWMYRTGRPNRIAAAMNRVGAVIASAGLGGNRMITMEVRGRRTGCVVALPLVPVDHRGGRYLVAMLGERTQWVANVRAAGGNAVLRSGRRTPVILDEVDVSERAPILQRYLQLAPGARPHIPVDRHAGLDEFEAIARRFPVFRVRPVSRPAAGR